MESETLFVACYNEFDDLAHQPRGTPSPYEKTIRAIKLNAATGAVTPLGAIGGVHNAAFMRRHPSAPVIYVCTETIEEDGEIYAFEMRGKGGSELALLGKQSAHGTSTCFLSLTPGARQMLAVNYWDSSLVVLPITPDGHVKPAIAMRGPPAVVKASGRGDHLINRQSEPHAHSIVLDPVHKRLAFVPDLGLDVVRMYAYKELTDDARSAAADESALVLLGTIACAPKEAGPHGPRYIEFDRSERDTAFVVNELSSTVSVFRYDADAAARMLSSLSAAGEGAREGDAAAAVAPSDVLQLVQVVTTLPSPPPPTSTMTGGKNTCGRVAVDPAGRNVLVSNRGHDSIAVLRMERDASAGCHTLTPLEVTSTNGRTPRHFQFACGGRYVLAANQDSDSCSVFAFDAATGHLSFTGHEFACGSPNFICSGAAQAVEAEDGQAIGASVSADSVMSRLAL